MNTVSNNPASLISTGTLLPGPEVRGPLRVSFLGPFGTFSEQATREITPRDATLIPAAGVEFALHLVRTGEALSLIHISEPTRRPG